MQDNHFYAMLSRMKYINRWGLMRNTRSENICEHSLEVAFIARSVCMRTSLAVLTLRGSQYSECIMM